MLPLAALAAGLGVLVETVLARLDRQAVDHRVQGIHDPRLLDLRGATGDVLPKPPVDRVHARLDLLIGVDKRHAADVGQVLGERVDAARQVLLGRRQAVEADLVRARPERPLILLRL